MIPSFDPTIVSGYGILGQATAREMASTLKAHSLSLTYNPENKRFTILNTSDLDKDSIEKIFSKAVYEGWYPQVLDETDEAGNRLAQLGMIAFKNFEESYQPITPIRVSLSSKLSLKDKIAEEVVSDITRYLGVSFSGKTCLDVGCYSGENTIAMANLGAQVIGIDPDDSEFETARMKGMTDRQLIKATLQQYHTQFPDQQFDIVTLFLWNISALEREEVGAALAQIIKSVGTVIVSYHDQLYDDDVYMSVPNLMSKFFWGVDKFEFHGLNRYMLKCSYPKI